jgi:SNF2 family DNA or RNA helicase
MEPMDVKTAAMLPCAHPFHMKCIGALMSAHTFDCPTCRAPFKQGDVMLVSGGADSICTPSRDIERFGSKLTKIATTLRDIQKGDPAAKAIVFVQWKELEALVGAALTGLGIEHIRLKGTTVQRSGAIASFQQDSGTKVLLQSLENSASGANLTRASHVLLVHPMDAESHDRAVAYEKQALGRVRRCGQTAAHVHLYRFVTKGTVEEEISREHQAGVSASLRSGGSSASRSAGA